MHKLLTLIVLSTLAAPLAARADGSIQLNARGGVAFPLGENFEGQKLSGQIDNEIPLQADLQFRFLKNFSAGGFFRYGFTNLGSDAKTACDASGATGCKVEDIAFGLLGEYRFSDKLEGGPWIGAQLGYEMYTAQSKIAGALNKMRLTGFELGVSGGMDFELGGITLGPWAFANFGQFDKYDLGSGSGSGSIANKKIHGLVGVGLRLGLLL